MSTPIPAEPRERRQAWRRLPALPQDSPTERLLPDEDVETPIPDWYRREESIFFGFVFGALSVFILIVFLVLNFVFR